MAWGRHTSEEIAEYLGIPEEEVIRRAHRITTRKTMYNSTRNYKYKYGDTNQNATKYGHDNGPDNDLNPILS